MTREVIVRGVNFRSIVVIAFLLLAPSASAESVQYYLERVAIHARLLQTKLSDEPVGAEKISAFQSNLSNLLDDVDQWKTSAGGATADEVRGGLDGYRQVLLTSKPSAGLNINQSAALSLLLLEMEQASDAIAGGVQKDSLGNLRIQPARSSNSGFWGAYGPWGGFAGPWGPGCDPWGPYFGRPLNPGSCPYYW